VIDFFLKEAARASEEMVPHYAGTASKHSQNIANNGRSKIAFFEQKKLPPIAIRKKYFFN
jgi:hypothetical protein